MFIVVIRQWFDIQTRQAVCNQGNDNTTKSHTQREREGEVIDIMEVILTREFVPGEEYLDRGQSVKYRVVMTPWFAKIDENTKYGRCDNSM